MLRMKLLTLGILKTSFRLLSLNRNFENYWETGRIPSLHDWDYNFVVLLSVGLVVLVVLPDLAADSCLR